MPSQACAKACGKNTRMPDQREGACYDCWSRSPNGREQIKAARAQKALPVEGGGENENDAPIATVKVKAPTQKEMLAALLENTERILDLLEGEVDDADAENEEDALSGAETE